MLALEKPVWREKNKNILNIIAKQEYIEEKLNADQNSVFAYLESSFSS